MDIIKSMRLAKHKKPIALAVIFFLSLSIFPLLSSSAQPIKLLTAYQDSYPKYYQSDPTNTQQISGLCIDISKAIEKTASIQIDGSSGFVPFKRLQQQLANSTIDIFIGMAQNDRRKKQYIFIETPLYEVHHVIAVRADDTAIINNFNDIRALAPDNTILTNNGTATERFLKKQGGLSVDAGGTTLKANLMKLERNRGRFFYFHDIGLLGAIKQYGYTGKIKVLPASYKAYYHYVALAPDTPEEVVALIETAVKQLAANGELARIKALYTKGL